jgi:hypothetical protein
MVVDDLRRSVTRLMRWDRSVVILENRRDAPAELVPTT